MTEISLNILDVAENSTSAGADLVEIYVEADTKADTLTVIIKDDGCGMDAEQLEKVTDPFYTTRKTRKVGLGVPFLKQAAEDAGGEFRIESEVGKGTTVTAVFGLSNVDRMPLGDISTTIQNLIIYHTDTDFYYRYSYDGASFELDTRQMKEMLGGVPLDTPDVAAFIKEYLEENKSETDNGAEI